MNAARVLLTVAVLLAAAPPAGAAETATSPVAVERLLDLVPSDLAERGTVGVLRAAARLDDLRLAAPGPTAPEAQLPAGTPDALAGPVRELLSAVELAASEFRVAVPVSADEAHAAIDAAASLPAVDLSSPQEPPDELQRLEQRFEQRVDRARMLRAAISLAETIERSLPALRSAAGQRVATNSDACDVVDALPAVCIGDDGPNTYAAPAAVQIDLGGDDVYLNGPGTANFIPPVGISIDLAGSDRYLSVREGSGPLPPVQGSALLGIGMLLDLAGDDRYTVADTPTAEGGDTTLVGQGYGVFGVGVLEDREGNDVYETRMEGRLFGTAKLQAQGYGSFGGVGAVVDGAGNDVYLASARPTLTSTGTGGPVSGNGTAEGQGLGLFGGAGILADAAGNDVALLEARTAPLPPGAAAQQVGATATVAGGGLGSIGGLGLASWGVGSTSWILRAQTSGPSAGPARIDGLAVGSAGGAGLITDGGGDDTYRAEGLSTTVISDDCSCAPSAVATAGAVQTSAVGVGLGGGSGLLRDLSGDDRYEIVARSFARAESHDRRPDPKGGFAGATAGSAFAGGIAAGALGGVGTVEDESGDDTYVALAESRADAESTPLGLGTSAGQAASAATGVEGYGSTGGTGLLRDLDGADSYSSTSYSWAFAPGGTESADTASTSAQGSVSGELPPVPGDMPGIALVVDLGAGTDTFSTLPPDPACTGTRGGQTWLDCSPGLAGGTNP